MTHPLFRFWTNGTLKRNTSRLLLVFAFLNIALFYLTGAGSVLLAISLLWLVFFTCYMIIKKIAPPTLHVNLITSLVAFLATLLVGELVLRYVVKHHQSYNERKGSFFYSSPYERWNMANILWKLLVKKNSYWRIAQQPNICDVISSPTEFSYWHCYNGLGLRGKLPDTTKTNLLIGLGDSFTEGVGVSDDSTWVALVARYRKMAFLNAGIIGSDPVMELEILKELLKKYKPTEVILAIHSNDLSDLVMRGGINRYDAHGNIKNRPAPWFDILYAAFFVCRSVAHDVFHLNYFLMSNRQWSQELKLAENTLVSIVKNEYIPLSHTFGFKFTVVIFPSSYELQQPSFVLENLYSKLSAIKNLNVIQLFSCYREKAQAQNLKISTLYWSKDGHHTPQGYALMADCISSSIP